jgi:hypothetical protein
VDWEGDGESSQKGLEGNRMRHIQTGPASFCVFIDATSPGTRIHIGQSHDALISSTTSVFCL